MRMEVRMAAEPPVEERVPRRGEGFDGGAVARDRAECERGRQGQENGLHGREWTSRRRARRLNAEALWTAGRVQLARGATKEKGRKVKKKRGGSKPLFHSFLCLFLILHLVSFLSASPFLSPPLTSMLLPECDVENLVNLDLPGNRRRSQSAEPESS